MKTSLHHSFIKGVERLSVWEDLLDRINVFPVADKDTGRNLVISLSPLRQINGTNEDIIKKLLESACGNSGNIAARFFSGFLTATSPEQILQASILGRESALKAILDPKPGTMLTVFDALIEILEKEKNITDKKVSDKIITHLKNAVLSTRELLPELKQAGVVDSGALGMFIFFEGFFKSIAENDSVFPSIIETFKNSLKISPEYFNNSSDEKESGYCINALIKSSFNLEKTPDILSGYGESIIVSSEDEHLKIHAHTNNIKKLKEKLETLGEIVNWSEENMSNNANSSDQVKSFPFQYQLNNISGPSSDRFHIMTDAAGSFPRKQARELGVTLLDSYIVAGNNALPESHFDPSNLYRIMKKGKQVSTSQASVFERHQHYQKAINQYQKVLYLCTGSVYTGNYNAAVAWKQENDPENQMAVIDTGAASGRLGVIAIMCARYLSNFENTGVDNSGNNSGDLIKFAENVIEHCEEYVFLDRLQYLAASGRLSKTGAFFGDFFNMKPVISPLAEGAKKVGMVKNQDSQIKFALDKLERKITNESSPFIMIEYTDNEQWIKNTVQKQVQNHYPKAELFICPLSLTSGVHMGPGTWSIAFLPEAFHF
ncbi:DegV family protein [Desulfobacterales bacterium HSG17]|nr:DegV family protein [Desulfobacterales bacterium HSG17]